MTRSGPALAILAILATGCPSDDGPRAPDDSSNPGPADDGTSGAKPATEPPAVGDGDGDPAVDVCEDRLRQVEVELAACLAAAKPAG